ncbi:MAG: dihydrodipicolinate reductase [Phycisphaerales bacterium]|nr:MAG: dihydrodipicolinate reductase [Phycisphaerales bacterium]
MMRFVQVGLGPLGRRILAEAIERGVGHAVGVVDRDPTLVGKSVASIVPNADPRLTVVASLDDLHDWAAVDAAIVATSSDLAKCADTFRTLLEHGKAVVSTCEELLYPWLRHVALAEELDDLAKRHGGRLLGTGVNPGFLMDTLPVVLSGVCKGLRRVTVQRLQDASTRRIPFQQKIGAGLDDDAFAARIREGSLRHVGLGESLHFIAHFVGLPIERWEEDIAPVHADRELPSALGPIAKGRVSGVRQTARGYHDDQCVVHLEFQAAIGLHDPVDRVTIDAEPRLEVSIPGGVHGDTATCAIAVNALPRIIEATPGLHTMASIGAIRHTAASNGHLTPHRV